MNIFVSNSIVYLNDIQNLYIDAFASGESAQFIDNELLEIYLSSILKSGNAIIIVENNMIVACLLYTSLKNDKDCPATITLNFDINHCAYIAEVMVHSQFRKSGYGKKLLEYFFDNVTDKYTQVFIRVWDKNEIALKLYQNNGFKIFDSIEQEKLSPDKSQKIKMTKLYLYKAL
jgi:ribosomal protein S18 acetylase RimI-like enzyme